MCSEAALKLVPKRLCWRDLRPLLLAQADLGDYKIKLLERVFQLEGEQVMFKWDE
jgi:hypothetical protein